MKKRWITSGAMAAAVLFGGMAAQAETIVDFTHNTGTGTFRAADTTTATGSIRSFSDTNILVSNPEAATESNTTVYGGLKASWPDGQPDDGVYQLSPGDNDSIRLQIKDNGVNGRREMEGMFIWNKADFLGLTSETIGFDATSSMSLNINQNGTFNIGFVVNDGGTYYVSQVAGESGASAAITDMAAETWATISTDDNYTIGSYATRAFTDVQGVGFYLNKGSNNNQVIFKADDFKVDAVVIPEPATLGMIAALGGGIFFIRRRFMM